VRLTAAAVAWETTCSGRELDCRYEPKMMLAPQ
jgi:hypothetical protein